MKCISRPTRSCISLQTHALSATGELRGLTYKRDGTIYSKPYVELMAEIIKSDDAELLQDFVLLVDTPHCPD